MPISYLMARSSLRIYVLYFVMSTLIMYIVTQQIFAARNSIIEESKNSLHNYSSITEEALSGALERIDDILYTVAHGDGFIDLRQSETAKSNLALRVNNLSNSSGVEVRVFDKTGALVWESVKSKDGQSVNNSDRNWFKKLKVENIESLVFFDPVISKIRKVWVVPVARRINDRQGRFQGVAVASLSVDFFSSFISKIQLGENGLFLVMVGKSRKVVYQYPHKEDSLGKEIKLHQNMNPILFLGEHRGLYQVVSPWDQVARFNAATWIGKFPVLVIIGKDTDGLLASWQKQTFINVLVVSSSLLIGFVFLVGYTRSTQKITAQQAQLAANSKLVALGEMSGAIAHEINNPLTVILGCIQHMRRLALEEPQDADKFFIHLNKIEHTAKRISKIVKGLNIFSRQETTETKGVLIQDLLDEVYNISSERFKVNAVRLDLINHHPSLKFKVNEVQMIQVFVNLLNNSFDAISQFDERWVKVEVRASARSVTILVTDSGLGIPPHIVSRLMEPFFTTKEIGKGTGLGLSISKGIVESFGGKFYYDRSSSNTRFVIELPLYEELMLARVA